MLQDVGVFENYHIVDRLDGPYLHIQGYSTLYRIDSFWYLLDGKFYDINFIEKNKWNRMNNKELIIEESDDYIIVRELND